MSSNSINIAGLNKVDLLYRMWKEQKNTGNVFFGLQSLWFDEDLAKTVVGRNRYIDYFCGKIIKTDLSRDEVDPWAYDRETYTGRLREIVNVMKAEEAKKLTDGEAKKLAAEKTANETISEKASNEMKAEEKKQ
jgi:hypothetical protein